VGEHVNAGEHAPASVGAETYFLGSHDITVFPVISVLSAQALDFAAFLAGAASGVAAVVVSMMPMMSLSFMMSSSAPSFFSYVRVVLN
jgi:hypothetical protein